MRLRRLEPVLRLALRGPCRLPAHARLLVAVSGGADSTALLVALASLAREFEISLTAAHLHHGLRGADADADLAHVRALCAELGVPLVAARWDARARMKRAGLAGEAGLRTLRRRFLRAAMQRTGAKTIATAHTADDQLETVLMRLARGTSLAGLGGMRPRHGAWIKPLLGATRDDVLRDLVAARRTWRDDASNATRDALRNRVRHDVVPALVRALAGTRAAGVAARPREPRANANARAARELAAQRAAAAARAGLARRVAQAAADARGGAALAARWAKRVLARHGTPRAVAVAPLRHVPPVLQAAAFRRLWATAAPRTCGLTARHVEPLRRLIAGRTGAAVALPRGFHAFRTRDRIEIRPPARRDARLRVHGSRALRRNGHSRPAASRKSTPLPTQRRTASRLERHE